MDEHSTASEIVAAVRAVYEAAERHDFTALRAFHAMDGAFSRWSGQPGGELLGFAAAQDEEEAMFGAQPATGQSATGPAAASILPPGRSGRVQRRGPTGPGVVAVHCNLNARWY